MNCPSCGSPNLFLLGRLGSITWIRCRDCGIDIRAKDEIIEIDGED